jgi:hypothetical protein
MSIAPEKYSSRGGLFQGLKRMAGVSAELVQFAHSLLSRQNSSGPTHSFRKLKLPNCSVARGAVCESTARSALPDDQIEPLSRRQIQYGEHDAGRTRSDRCAGGCRGSAMNVRARRTHRGAGGTSQNALCFAQAARTTRWGPDNSISNAGEKNCVVAGPRWTAGCGSWALCHRETVGGRRASSQSESGQFGKPRIAN